MFLSYIIDVLKSNKRVEDEGKFFCVDKMQFKCSSCQWFQLLGFAIALKNYIIVDFFNGIIINNISNLKIVIIQN